MQSSAGLWNFTKSYVSHSTKTNTSQGMQYGLKVDIPFSRAKQLLVVCREQLGIKGTEFESKVLHSFKTANWIKKNNFCRFKVVEMSKCMVEMSNLILVFSKIPNIFICVRVRQGAFLSENWKCYPSEAVPSLQCFALEMRKRKAYKKQIGSNVSVLLDKISALDHHRFK